MSISDLQHIQQVLRYEEIGTLWEPIAEIGDLWLFIMALMCIISQQDAVFLP